MVEQIASSKHFSVSDAIAEQIHDMAQKLINRKKHKNFCINVLKIVTLR